MTGNLSGWRYNRTSTLRVRQKPPCRMGAGAFYFQGLRAPWPMM
ncbi:hypothetical protein AmDm5_2319 [Acetobacter malorum]|nr:hypothetical protein AmDm5_2319 [Acetobacter malorum]